MKKKLDSSRLFRCRQKNKLDFEERNRKSGTEKYKLKSLMDRSLSDKVYTFPAMRLPPFDVTKPGLIMSQEMVFRQFALLQTQLLAANIRAKIK